MTPRALYRLEVTEGTRLVVCALYDDEDVDPTAVRAWEEGRSAEPPFVWRSAGYEALQDITGRSRSRVAEDLSQLADLGVIRRAKRDGRRGWELLGTRPEVPAVGPSGPSRGTRGSQNADARVPAVGPSGPSRGTLAATTRVPAVGPTGPSSGTSGSHRQDPASAHPRADAKIIQPVDDRLAAPSAPHPAKTAPQPASRPALPAARPDDEKLKRPASPAPLVRGLAEADLVDLVNEIGRAFIPVDADGREMGSRRIRPDVATLDRVRRLLRPPPGTPAADWVPARFAEVRRYALDYARLCQANGQQAIHWGPAMLESIPATVRGKSAWETLTRLVDAWLADKASAAAEERIRREVAARPPVPAAPPIQPMDPEAVKAVADEFLARQQPRRDPSEKPELTEADEARARSAGYQRETDEARAVAREQHVRRRINAAFSEFNTISGRMPTADEANEIRRRIRAEEAAQT